MAAIANIVMYADDPPRLADFWADVLGYPHARFEGELRERLLAEGLTEQDLDRRGLAEDPEGNGPRLFFHHADGPKAVRNRMHVDVSATPGRRPTPRGAGRREGPPRGAGRERRPPRRPAVGALAGAVLPVARPRGQRVLPAVTAQATPAWRGRSIDTTGQSFQSRSRA